MTCAHCGNEKTMVCLNCEPHWINVDWKEMYLLAVEVIRTETKLELEQSHDALALYQNAVRAHDAARVGKGLNS